jgi:dihydrofolate synthase/folylpolyglutamate synthase
MRAEYASTLEWLFGLENMGIKLGVGRTRRLLSAMGDPQRSFRTLHVAGSKGKGSTCAMLESVLRCSGVTTGLYTSPHLVDFRERIRVCGEMIPEADVARLAAEAREAAKAAGMLGDMTFFEMTTAMALRYFQERGVQLAVVEVGLGGALDATNAVEPCLTVVTRIDVEHARYLGSTEAEIAFEKAGILKDGVPVVVGEGQGDALRVIEAAAGDLGCPVKMIGRDFRRGAARPRARGTEVGLPQIGRTVTIPLHGTYQADNAAVACAAALLLREQGVPISEAGIASGLAKVAWPGRLQVVARRPLLIFDVTHTPEGASASAPEMRRMGRGPLVIVIGVLEDKDIDGIAEAFAGVANEVVCAAPRSGRAMPIERMQTAFRRQGVEPGTASSIGEAMDTACAIAGRDGTVVLTGSFYTVGEGMKWLGQRKK